MRKSRLLRTTLSLSLLLGVAALGGLANQAAASGLVSSIEAQRAGLTRAWFSQAELDRSRHRVENAVLDGDTLFVLTTAGVLHAMDAETGKTKWISRLGNPNYPSLGPAASDKYVALVNGSTLIVLNRETGVEKMSHQLGGGAGGAPAITNKHVYVPLFTGKVEAYPLDDEDEQTWYYSSAGRVFQPMTATTDSVVWPTQRGFLYVANPEANGVRYRFESTGLVNSNPASFDGNLFLSTSNGYVYDLNELTGQQKWRYSTGSSISRSPVAVGGKVFVTTDAPALHAISTLSGERQWRTGGIQQLAGVSQSRVYGMTRLGELVTMDLESGVPLASLRTSPSTWAVVNAQTDRIYLVSDTGLVQCLHEMGADQPFMHSGETPPAAAEQPAGAAPAAAEAPAAQPAQPAAEPEEQPAPTNPFGAPAGGSNPFETPADDSNPFDAGEGVSNPFGF